MQHVLNPPDLPDDQIPAGAPSNRAPHWYMLGRGYDVINGTINPQLDGLKQPLLEMDMDKVQWVKDSVLTARIAGAGHTTDEERTFMWSHPIYINPPETFTMGDAVYIESISQEDYGSSLRGSVKIAGSYYGFSASVEAQFGTSDSRVSNRRFVSRAGHYVFGALEAKPAEDLVRFLRAEARSDLLNLPPDALFDKYGTHYIHMITLGASIHDFYKFDEDKISAESSLRVKVAAAYKGLFSVKGSAEIDLQNTRAELESSSEHDVAVFGGDPTAASRMANGDDGAFEEWLASIFTLPVPTSFTENGLKPLWELVTDEGRRQELSDAYESYATSRAGRNLEQAMPIRDGDILAFRNFASGGWVEGNRGAFLRVASGGPRTDRARFLPSGIEGSRLRLRSLSSGLPINVFGFVNVKDAPGDQDLFEIVGPDAQGLFRIKTAENREGQVHKDSFWFLKEGDFGGRPEDSQGTDGTVNVSDDANLDPDLSRWRIFVLGAPLGG